MKYAVRRYVEGAYPFDEDWMYLVYDPGVGLDNLMWENRIHKAVLVDHDRAIMFALVGFFLVDENELLVQQLMEL